MTSSGTNERILVGTNERILVQLPPPLFRITTIMYLDPLSANEDFHAIKEMIKLRIPSFYYSSVM